MVLKTLYLEAMRIIIYQLSSASNQGFGLLGWGFGIGVEDSGFRI